MKNIQRALLINTHLTYPNWSEGTLNNAFFEAAKLTLLENGIEILETVVERGYLPLEEEQKHLAADLIILQLPINWFGAPWIYKKYVDEVFNSGLMNKTFLTGDGRSPEDPDLQYGTGGLLQGKSFMTCATWNAPAIAFSNSGQRLFEGKGLSDFFLQITSNYKFCGCEIREGYNCFDIFRRSKKDIAKDIADYPAHLRKVIQG